MVSTMGNAQRQAKGSFVLIDANDWHVKGSVSFFFLFFASDRYYIIHK